MVQIRLPVVAALSHYHCFCSVPAAGSACMGRYLLRFTVVYMKLWPHFLVALVVMGALSMWVYYGGAHPGGKASGLLDKITWQRMANPGPLTGGHAFLEHDCAACHTSVKGVEANNCIVCHANNKALL